MKKMKFKKIIKLDKEARMLNSLIGRYIKESIADGYAYYQIIKESKNRVTIKVCTGIGDDWRIPYYGDRTTISKEYAIQNLRIRDFWENN